ncbi:MAG: MMPL family transporter [Clostridiales bacterium]|nr:MMPL family transporter [Clostridiales bacterium]
MTKTILTLYDYFRKHPAIAWGSFLVLTGVLVISVLNLQYKEDISDFLPLDNTNHTALTVYQDVSGANNIIATVEAKDSTTFDPQILVDGVDTFVGIIEEYDTLSFVSNITKEIDVDKILDLMSDIYMDIPYFLTEDDYARIDTLLTDPNYIAQQLDNDKQMLLFPSSSLLTSNIPRDPLNLFTPVLTRIRQGALDIDYETHDSYILSPDSKKAIIIITSSFGANESEHNASLVNLLNKAKEKVETDNPNLDIHIIGGPAIAVTNATQIKNDSVLAIAIAAILILCLLIYAFKSARNIALILISAGWGWLFAMGGIALFYNSISIIVIGIASVILGIAVNYPLHLIDHLQNSSRTRRALREIISPLVVGNITTVGAFLCLVPLNSVALHDLGLFSSLLLAGTILFVLIYLPHAVKINKPTDGLHKTTVISRLAGISVEKNKWVVYTVIALTLLFAAFSFRTEFDADLRNINYMTPEQRADLEYFSKLQAIDNDSENLYIVSSGQEWDEALTQNEIIDRHISLLETRGFVTRKKEVTPFLPSMQQQERSLSRWQEFIDKHKEKLTAGTKSVGASLGFSEEAFADFYDILDKNYDVRSHDYFESLNKSLLLGNLSEDSVAQRRSVVQIVEVKPEDVERVKKELNSIEGFYGMAFDIKSMNSSITNTLTADFNYIGIACGFIVFVFLWISLGSIELATVSFLPMAVSWIWILGLMGLLGIRFNIVNIILATFIFGQGDDYTIFMTEGLSFEFAYRKKLLASYKNSIIISALIMFIGIGTLVFAKHPAMRSLGEVTITGMLSVVIMAYLFPPLIFNWLVKKNGVVRYRPVTLKKVLSTILSSSVLFIQLNVAYIIGILMMELTKPTPKKKLMLHRLCCSMFRWDVNRMPGIKYRFENPDGIDFSTPLIMTTDHQSFLSCIYLMTLTPKIILITNDHTRQKPITGRLSDWLDFITVDHVTGNMIEMLRPYVSQGYSICSSPTEAIELSNSLGLDLLPVHIHGLGQIMPEGSSLLHGGTVIMTAGRLIARDKPDSAGSSITAQIKTLTQQLQMEQVRICRAENTVAMFAPTVYDKYRYKGADVERKARKALKTYSTIACNIEHIPGDSPLLVIDEDGQGELPLLLAMMYPSRVINSYIGNNDGHRLLSCIIPGFVDNITVISREECDAEASQFHTTVQIAPHRRVVVFGQ